MPALLIRTSTSLTCEVKVEMEELELMSRLAYEMVFGGVGWMSRSVPEREEAIMWRGGLWGVLARRWRMPRPMPRLEPVMRIVSGLDMVVKVYVRL
jgi:hypothetical protein